MKTLKSLFVMFLLVAGLYVAWRLIPPYFANYQLEDAIANEARLNAYTTKSEQDMRDAIFRKAQDLEIPIRPEQIMVQRSANEVSIWTEYTVHVELPGYPMDLKFRPSSRNKRL